MHIPVVLVDISPWEDPFIKFIGTRCKILFAVKSASVDRIIVCCKNRSISIVPLSPPTANSLPKSYNTVLENDNESLELQIMQIFWN